MDLLALGKNYMHHKRFWTVVSRLQQSTTPMGGRSSHTNLPWWWYSVDSDVLFIDMARAPPDAPSDIRVKNRTRQAEIGVGSDCEHFYVRHLNLYDTGGLGSGPSDTPRSHNNYDLRLRNCRFLYAPHTVTLKTTNKNRRGSGERMRILINETIPSGSERAHCTTRRLPGNLPTTTSRSTPSKGVGDTPSTTLQCDRAPQHGALQRRHREASSAGPEGTTSSATSLSARPFLRPGLTQPSFTPSRRHRSAQ